MNNSMVFTSRIIYQENNSMFCSKFCIRQNSVTRSLLMQRDIAPIKSECLRSTDQQGTKPVLSMSLCQSNNTALPVNYSSLPMPYATSFGSIGMPRRLSCNSFFCYKCMDISVVISILFWRWFLCLVTAKEKEVCICVCMCLHAYLTATVYISLRRNC